MTDPQTCLHQVFTGSDRMAAAPFSLFSSIPPVKTNKQAAAPGGAICPCQPYSTLLLVFKTDRCDSPAPCFFGGFSRKQEIGTIGKSEDRFIFFWLIHERSPQTGYMDASFDRRFYPFQNRLGAWTLDSPSSVLLPAGPGVKSISSAVSTEFLHYPCGCTTLLAHVCNVTGDVSHLLKPSACYLMRLTGLSILLPFLSSPLSLPFFPFLSPKDLVFLCSFLVSPWCSNVNLVFPVFIQGPESGTQKVSPRRQELLGSCQALLMLIQSHLLKLYSFCVGEKAPDRRSNFGLKARLNCTPPARCWSRAALESRKWHVQFLLKTPFAGQVVLPDDSLSCLEGIFFLNSAKGIPCSLWLCFWP